jgi:hypothetical protein
MTETRDKLNEANYFLERMKDTQSSYYAATQRGRDAFRYDLGAFLSAARSVTFFMQKEYKGAVGKNTNFETWYSLQQTQMKSDETMVFLLEQRNKAIHQGSVQPHGITAISVVEHNPITEFVVAVSIPVNATEEERKNLIAEATPPEPLPAPPIEPTQTSTTQSWFFNELLQKGLPSDVVTLCEEHIAKLERLVDECESCFVPRS